MIASKPSQVPVEALVESYRRTTFWLDSSGVRMAALQNHGIPGFSVLPGFREALEEAEALFGTVRNVMLNELEPGRTVPIHTDADNGLERWHLPILTNDEAYWWDLASGEVRMAVGSWWGPVPFAQPHRVGNRGGTTRVHLIVDVEGGTPHE